MIITLSLRSTRTVRVQGLVTIALHYSDSTELDSELERFFSARFAMNPLILRILHAGDGMYSDAIFIGTDGLNGFAYGKQYNVYVFTRNNYIWVQHGINVCWYSSMKEFLAQWVFIS